MQHKVKLTVIDKKLYTELQNQYCLNPNSGSCPMYNIGDEFLFERYAGKDDFWTMGKGNQCSEAWDAINRYIYTGLQGGSIMREWMKDEKVMIACCSDGTRPVIFKIERIDYKAVYIKGIKSDKCREKIKNELIKIDFVTNVKFRKEDGFDEFAEVYVDNDVKDEVIESCIKSLNDYSVINIE